MPLLAAVVGAPAAHAIEVTFTLPVDVQTPRDGVESVAMADLDRDGDLDMASASRDDDIVAWHENAAGDGSDWTAHDIVTDLDQPNSVQIGDIDGDGDPDIVVTASSQDEIVLFENSAGDASVWTSSVVSTTADDPREIAIADLDGDGDHDLAAASIQDHTISWYENTAGDGSAWTATNIATDADQARAIVAGDIDGDGDIDLAAAIGLDHQVVWYENTVGDASTWAAAASLNGVDEFPHPRAVAIADMNEDGDLDVVATSNAGLGVVWFDNTAGDGSAWTLVEVSELPPPGASDVEPVDLDVDGDLDLVTSAEFDDRTTWYENTAGNGSAWTGRHIDETDQTRPRGIATGDLDGDGDPDLAAALTMADKLVWYESQLASRSRSAWDDSIAPVATNADLAQSVAVGDIDRDGDLDLASASADDDTIAWYENSGDGSSWTPMDVNLLANAAQSVVASDLDGDGDLDLASASAQDSTIAWYENTAGNGSAWTGTNISTNALAAQMVAAGDIDGDGDMDLASASLVDDKIAWYENTVGDGSAWTPATVTTLADNARAVTPADLDGDGDLDLASAGFLDDEIAWYENTAGDGSAWTRAVIDVTADEALDVKPGDVDGDGDIDLVSASQADDTIAWYENTAGDGSAWAPNGISVNADFAQAVAVGDLDGDGDLDISSASNFDDKIAVYENMVGDGTAWDISIVRTDVDAATALAIGDLDDDGSLDIASTGADDDTVAWARAIPTLSIEDASGSEGEEIDVSVTAGRIHEQVEVDLSTAAGTASEGVDYTSVTDVHVTLPPGQGTHVEQVTTIEDDIDESNEVFDVLLDTPVGAQIFDAAATVTITDDDPTPELSVGDVTVTEKDSGNVSAKFALELANPSSVDVTVQAKTAKDTAKKDVDYVHKDKLITIPDGDTSKNVTVSVKGDKIDEDTEKFFLDLSSPANAVLGDDRGKGTIKDDDPKPKLSIENEKKKEGDSGKTKFKFLVKLNKESGKTVKATCKPVEKSAKAPSDFKSKKDKVTLEPGDKKEKCIFKVKGDRDNEGKEKFLVKLTNVSNAGLDDKKAKGIVRDDD